MSCTATLECPIRYNAEDKPDHGWVTLIPCGHLFHGSCVESWITSKGPARRRDTYGQIVPARLEWPCPICRCRMPHRPSTLSDAESLMLSRRYVAIKLDVAVGVSASSQGVASLQARIEELEAEIKELKEDRAHWKHVCEVTEATHVELMEMRSDTWRAQLEAMRMKLVEAEKVAEDSRKRAAAIGSIKPPQTSWADAITVIILDCPDRIPSTPGSRGIIRRNGGQGYNISPSKTRVYRSPKKCPEPVTDVHRPLVAGAQTTPPSPSLDTTDSPSSTK